MTTQTPVPQNRIILNSFAAAWAKIFEQERETIRQAFGPWIMVIEHVGSTSIEGMVARSEIDILALVTRVDKVDGARSALATAGYKDKSDPAADPERKVFVKNHPGAEATVRLLVYADGNQSAEEMIIFRDSLRENPDLAWRYAELRKKAAEAAPEDLAGYEAKKAEFVSKVLREEGLD